MSHDEAELFVERLRSLMNAVAGIPAPTIAAADGEHVMGGGRDCYCKMDHIYCTTVGFVGWWEQPARSHDFEAPPSSSSFDGASQSDLFFSWLVIHLDTFEGSTKYGAECKSTSNPVYIMSSP